MCRLVVWAKNGNVSHFNRSPTLAATDLGQSKHLYGGPNDIQAPIDRFDLNRTNRKACSTRDTITDRYNCLPHSHYNTHAGQHKDNNIIICAPTSSVEFTRGRTVLGPLGEWRMAARMKAVFHTRSPALVAGRTYGADLGAHFIARYTCRQLSEISHTKCTCLISQALLEAATVVAVAKQSPHLELGLV